MGGSGKGGGWTFGDVLRSLGRGVFGNEEWSAHEVNVMRRLIACGSGALGWRLYGCGACGDKTSAPLGCQDRHCPSCSGEKSFQWIAEREKELLPVSYVHNVFTLPPKLRDVALENKGPVYDLLMTTVGDILMELALTPRYMGATPTMFSVLHTSNRRLAYHPHVHVVMSAGGYDESRDTFVHSKSQKWLFPVKVMAPLFRGRFMDGLKQLYAEGVLTFRFPKNAPLSDPHEWQKLVDELYAGHWHVYAKKAFGGPESVIRYLGSYTHRTPIKNRQIVDFDAQRSTVTYAHVDRKTGKERRETSGVRTFVSQFKNHILPKGFHRVRRFGLLSRTKAALLSRAQELAKASVAPAPPRAPRALDGRPCLCCGGVLAHVETVRFQRRKHDDWYPVPRPSPWPYRRQLPEAA